MKPRLWLVCALGGTAVLLLLVILGCGGASLNTGGNRNLEQVSPDFVDPPWYEDYENDHQAAYARYDKKVIQIGLRVSDTEDSPNGTEVTGSTGDGERYRAGCKFPASSSTSIQNVRSGDFIVVKGLFDHMQELSNSYKIYLKNCVVVEG